MSALIPTPKTSVSGFKPAIQENMGGPAPVNYSPPAAFETTPETRYPAVPSKEQLLAGPDTVPFEVFHKIVAGNPKLADKFVPGISGPDGYKLLQADANGMPVVKLTDPIAFAALANDVARKAQEKVASRQIQMDPIQSRQVQLDPIGEEGSVGEPEITGSGLPQTQAELMRDPSNPVPSTVDTGEAIGSGDAVEYGDLNTEDFIPGLGGAIDVAKVGYKFTKALGVAGLKKLVSLAEKHGVEEGTRIYMQEAGGTLRSEVLGKKPVGARQMGFGATKEQEAAYAASQGQLGSGKIAAPDAKTAASGKGGK